MALLPGTRLGPYEITAPIGVGGMGEVYRATDTKLKRQVASSRGQYAVTKDGKRFLATSTPGPSSVAPLTVVVNWTATIRK